MQSACAIARPLPGETLDQHYLKTSTTYHNTEIMRLRCACADRHATQHRDLSREAHMSHVEQFEKAVTEAGAVALRIERKPQGEERLVIQTRGGLITKAVPLKGDLGKDIQDVTAAARQIVASAKSLTAEPAKNLSMSQPPKAAAATAKCSCLAAAYAVSDMT
jgi:hypothetical protein